MPAPAPAARLGWDQVGAWRTARHHLDERAPAGTMLEVAARIAGVHAQVLPSAELPPVLLVGGRMEGVWRQEARGRRLVVTIEPFAGPPPARVRRAAEAEAERLAAFSGAELELRWAEPAARGGAATG